MNRKMRRLLERVAAVLDRHGLMSAQAVHEKLRGEGVRATPAQVENALQRLAAGGRLPEPAQPAWQVSLGPKVLSDVADHGWDYVRDKMRGLLERDGYTGPALEKALRLKLAVTALLAENGPLDRDEVIDRLSRDGWDRGDLDGEFPHPETRLRVPGIYPAWDRGHLPPVAVAALKAEMEALVAAGEEVPYSAYVSGPTLNLRVEFEIYCADDKPLVRRVLLGLIAQGADRIVTTSEFWFREVDGTAAWDGVMIAVMTPAGDDLHIAEFEGKCRLGEWRSMTALAAGNLGGLFEAARQGEGQVALMRSAPAAGMAGTPAEQSDETTLRSWLPPGA